MRYSIRFMNRLSHIEKTAKAMAQLNPVELVTPVNFAKQKESWISLGDFGNPCFQYDKDRLSRVVKLKADVEEARKVVEEETFVMNDIDRVTKQILLARFDEALTTIELCASILHAQNSTKKHLGIVGIDATTAEAVIDKYGCPSNTLVLEAYAKAEEGTPYSVEPDEYPESPNREQLEALSFDAEAIAYWFNAVIEYYEFAGWSVVIDSNCSSIDVRDKAENGMRVVIPVDRKVNGQKLLELIGHELECHLRDTENAHWLWATVLGDDSPLEAFIPILAKSDDEMFYEGHAKLSDIALGGKSAIPLPYATIGIDLARRGSSFGEIASCIYEYRRMAGQSEKAALSGAWTTTYRVLRGSTSMNNAEARYAFTKDYAYLAGWKQAKDADALSLNFSSMKLGEIQSLAKAGLPMDILHLYKNAVSWVREQILR